MDWKLILQITGIALGLLYLWLEYRADIRLWIVGLVMPLVHGALYYRSGLYADASMQAYYVLAGLYGWVVWRRTTANDNGGSAVGDRRHETPTTGKVAPRISRTPGRLVPGLVGVYVAAHAAIYLILAQWTNSTVPFWDSMTTAASIVAMWMLSRKYLEQWLVWLIGDFITVGLYIYKGIPFTAGLYGLYSVLAAAGYFRWRRMSRSEPEQVEK